jgi:hypothetical protein
MRPYLTKIIKTESAENMSQMVDKHEAMSSNPSMFKKKGGRGLMKVIKS